MPAAMHLTTVSLSLLTSTVRGDATISSGTTRVTPTTTRALHTTSSSAASSTEKTLTFTPQSTTATQFTTSVVSASPQTPTAEETSPSNTPPNTTISQTSNVTVTQNQTVSSTSEFSNVTTGTSGNASVSALSNSKGNYNLAANPGLVAVICIFSIVLGLLSVVMMVKCFRSPKSKFERLEDVPMGKVNEASPFAQYTK